MTIKFSSIIAEEGQLSQGRVMSLIVFGILIWFWVTGGKVPPTLVESFWGLLVYNGGKKVTGPLMAYLQFRKTGKMPELPAPPEVTPPAQLEAKPTPVKTTVISDPFPDEEDDRIQPREGEA